MVGRLFLNLVNRLQKLLTVTPIAAAHSWAVPPIITGIPVLRLYTVYVHQHLRPIQISRFFVDTMFPSASRAPNSLPFTTLKPICVSRWFNLSS